ncbi:hypothetical protein [Rickettsia helvetica]|uniref:DUF2267 domain-containing protein n=1 Tax=Rickettsia helvetica TaxID=35789 RepID=A0ABM9NCT6_RICHE|nr:hypothetical protein [Rickettsia helvetica]MCZ6883940.1 hypothetical protein [Rickettsia endosymbiont of Ixodes ricinus]MCZ6897047.1 hypothetical protein [Rickettsia endosymbiont of Ixodes ricinus]
MLRDPTLLAPLSNAIMENAIECFCNKPQRVINDKKLKSKENIDKFTKLVNQGMQSFAVIQENLSPNISIEENKKVASALLPAISKLPPEKMTEQGREIIKNFAPLLESKHPALVNGAKKVLSELDPGYLAEHGRGEDIALEL